MIAAHTRIFELLDSFCSNQGDPIKNAGNMRWIATSGKVDKERLLYTKTLSSLSFSASMKICRMDIGNTSLFCTIGLNLPEEIDFLSEETLGGGTLTAIISELTPAPIASTKEIRNIVEVDDKSQNNNYLGHDFQLIAQLFPTIRCFSIENLPLEETQRLFFLLCLSDQSRAITWINSQLRETLKLIAELSPIAIPYKTLCRSIFDTDPSAVFMALYRCLEALYAYTQTKKLIHKLEIEKPWSEMAQILEETLNWRPREEQSLGFLLRYAVPIDLQKILSSLGDDSNSDGDLINRSTKTIYQLRNSIVHYRAFHQNFQSEKIEWNTLCESLALLVLHIYDEIN